MFNGLKVISADSHVFEPWYLWKERLPKQYLDRAPRVVDDDGTNRLVCADMPPVALKPGDLTSNDRNNGPKGEPDIVAAGYDPDARLPFLDEDGVDGEVLYPSTCLMFHAISDIPLKSQLFKAYNDWLVEFCAAYPSRFKGIAVLPHDDIDFAVQELARAKRIGLVGVMIPTVLGPDTPPYFHEFYDPLWRAAVEQEMPVHFHAATTGDKTRIHSNANGRNPVNIVNRIDYMQRTILGFFFGGVFDRHPNLQVVSAENNAGWLADLLIRADNEFHHYRRLPRIGFDHDPKQEPSYYWHRNCHATFWNEPAVVATKHLIGPETLMFQTDFPHGVTTYPNSMKILQDLLGGLPNAEQAPLLYGNATDCYGF